MKTTYIEYEGNKLPMRATMGALKEYEKQTGKSSGEIDLQNPVLASTFIYCCIQSACRKDGVPFGVTLDDFLDAVDADTITAWATSLSEANPT